MREKHDVLSWLYNNDIAIYEALVYKDVILAGGALRDLFMGEDPKDMDLFVKSEQHAEVVARFLVDRSEAPGMTRTKNAITLHRTGKANIQIITRWTYGTATEVIDSFDFTCCKVALRHDGEAFCFHEHSSFLTDSMERRLTYAEPVRVEDSAGSLLRVNRFLRRGWTIDNEDFIKVLARARADGDPALEAMERGVWNKLVATATRGY